MGILGILAAAVGVGLIGAVVVGLVLFFKNKGGC
jgi:hypothetical protein